VLAATLAGYAGGGPSTQRPPAAVAHRTAKYGLVMQSRSGDGEVAPSRKGLGTAGTLPISLTQSLDCDNGSKRSLRASDRLSGAAQRNLLVSLGEA
jgi:hypothetical protein